MYLHISVRYFVRKYFHLPNSCYKQLITYTRMFMACWLCYVLYQTWYRVLSNCIDV